MLVAQHLKCFSAEKPSPRITIDGNFTDWAFDPTTLSLNLVEKAPEFTLETVHTHHDAENLYFFIDIDKIKIFKA